jgi:hypothetical protein
MDTLESTTQSFIVKVWVEESARGDGQGVWQGHITHVPTGQRRYLKNLSEIEDFIAPHLEDMGVKLGMRWRVRRWFKRVRKRGNR